MKVPNSEVRVLQALWHQPAQTAKQVSEHLNEKGISTGVSSVQTLLRRLEARGLAAHTAVGKTFYYSATCEPEMVRSAQARDLLDRLFGGAISGFVTQLIDGEDVSDEELRELRDLVDSKLKEREQNESR